jgi:release factor glutamine methyltransferase
LSFKLWFGRRHARLRLERVNGLNLVVPPEVFNPTLFGSSVFMANYLRHNPPAPGAGCLDLGCGSGLLGLTLAKGGYNVLATDLNAEAVWASRVNAHLSGCEAVYEVRQGSLYAPVEPGRRFDLIVMNPPYYPGTPTTPLEAAFRAGPSLETLTALLVGAGNHLTPGGQALAVLTSTIPLETTLREVEAAGLEWDIAAKRRYWAEWHLIYRLRLKAPRAAP